MNYKYYFNKKLLRNLVINILFNYYSIFLIAKVLYCLLKVIISRQYLLIIHHLLYPYCKLLLQKLDLLI